MFQTHLAETPELVVSVTYDGKTGPARHVRHKASPELTEMGEQGGDFGTLQWDLSLVDEPEKGASIIVKTSTETFTVTAIDPIDSDALNALVAVHYRKQQPTTPEATS